LIYPKATTIEMNKHISTDDLKASLKDYSKYQLSGAEHQPEVVAGVPDEGQKSWIGTSKPILLIFAYVTGVTLLLEYLDGVFAWMRWMNNFMAGFFLVFSFFKLLNLKGFAESYSMHNTVAKK